MIKQLKSGCSFGDTEGLLIGELMRNGCVKSRNTTVIFDEDRDERLLRYIENLPTFFSKDLILAYEHEGSAMFIWSNENCFSDLQNIEVEGDSFSVENLLFVDEFKRHLPKNVISIEGSLVDIQKSKYRYNIQTRDGGTVSLYSTGTIELIKENGSDI